MAAIDLREELRRIEPQIRPHRGGRRRPNPLTHPLSNFRHRRSARPVRQRLHDRVPHRARLALRVRFSVGIFQRYNLDVLTSLMQRGKVHGNSTGLVFVNRRCKTTLTQSAPLPTIAAAACDPERRREPNLVRPIADIDEYPDYIDYRCMCSRSGRCWYFLRQRRAIQSPDIRGDDTQGFVGSTADWLFFAGESFTRRVGWRAVWAPLRIGFWLGCVFGQGSGFQDNATCIERERYPRRHYRRTHSLTRLQRPRRLIVSVA